MVDANILFSALIRNSPTRALIFRYPSGFLSPNYILQELQKYGVCLLRKSGLSSQEFAILLSRIVSRITMVSEEKLSPYGAVASAIVQNIDPDDASFVACALAYPGSIIWSEDKALKRQNRIPVLNTGEVLHLLRWH